MVERNAGVPPESRIEFRVGIHLGDVVEESDGDLMGDGVNIAARLEGVAKPGAICLSEDAYRQVKGRLDLAGHRSRPDPTQEHRRAGARLLARSRQVRATAACRARKARRGPAMAALLAALAIARCAVALAAGSLGIFSAAEGNRLTQARERRTLSLVVLPFTNLSGDASQDYLGDVLTEELTTSLSRLPDSFVVSRTTAFAYRGKART